MQDREYLTEICDRYRRQRVYKRLRIRNIGRKGRDRQMEEYIRKITEQIRCVRARESVAKELSDHILDQAAAYEEQGETYEEAVGRAVRGMGDPVEVGVALDRIHRPQMDVKLIVMVLVFSIGGFFLQLLIGSYSSSAHNDSRIFLSQFGRQSLILIVSFGVMAGMYFLDYSFIGRYAMMIYGGMTVLFLLLRISGREVNGRMPIMLMLVYLYLPVYAGILYQLRGKGIRAILLAVGMLLLTAVVSYYFSSLLHAALAVYGMQTVLLVLAIHKGWFRVDKKEAVIIVLTILVIVPLAIGMFSLVTDYGANQFRLHRIHAWLHPEEAPYEAGYTYLWIRDMLAQARLIGSSGSFPYDGIIWTPGLDPFILLEIICSFGILAGLLVILALAIVVIHAFLIVKRQKNQLGFMIAASCFMVFLDNCVEGILINSGYYPVTSLQVPFLSYGAGATITYAVLIGMLLSIYRNEKILTDDASMSRPVWRLCVRWEKR